MGKPSQPNSSQQRGLGFGEWEGREQGAKPRPSSGRANRLRARKEPRANGAPGCRRGHTGTTAETG